MWGVAWLESTEGERQRRFYVVVVFCVIFIINKRVFLQNKTTHGS